MSPEAEILYGLLDQLKRIERGADDAVALLGEPPADAAALTAASVLTRTASTAYIKTFEQFEETLGRLFRTLLKTLGYSLRGLSPLDIGNKAASLGWVDSGPSWLAAVKLRNEFAHEYPDDENTRFERLMRALAMLPMLRAIAARVREYISLRAEDLQT